MRCKRIACAVAALLVLCAPAGAFGAPEVIDSMEVLFVEGLSLEGAELSGNGRYVVCASGDTGSLHVQRIDLETIDPETRDFVTKKVPLPPSGGYQSDPRISDDGMTVVFTNQAAPDSGADNDIGVWREGWSEARLAPADGDQWMSDVSGDGMYMVFIDTVIDNVAGLVHNIGHRAIPMGFEEPWARAKQITDDSLYQIGPAVNGDGRFVTWLEVRVNEAGQISALEVPVCHVITGKIYEAIELSADQPYWFDMPDMDDSGMRIVWAEAGGTIHVYDLSVKSEIRSIPNSNCAPVISGNGRYVAWSRSGGIWMADLETGIEYEVVPSDENMYYEYPRISDNGRVITYIAHEWEDTGQNDSYIYVAHLDWGDVEDWLYQAEDLLEGLDEEAFGDPGWQDDLLSKLAEVLDKVEGGEYRGALNKLEKDLMKHVDTWVIDEDARENILGFFEDAVAGLEDLLQE